MKKVLIIQNKRIGDVLISSIIANNYKKQHPQSVVHFMAYEFTNGVLQNNPNIDKIIPIDEKELKKIPNLLKMIRLIRKEKYDIIFDPYSKTQSRLICKFSGAKITIGNKSRKKFGNLGYYTNPVELLKEKTHSAGKAIEDRIELLKQLPEFKEFDYVPKIFLKDEETHFAETNNLKDKKLVVFGILGSTSQKSMPYSYVARLVDFITEHYDVHVIFNYVPHQKEEALKIYDFCKNKSQIVPEIKAPTIRDFIKLMYQANVLVANEGGSVHIAKALDKPTFTIFSPYVKKEFWASFEDGIKHQSIHLFDIKPELYHSFSRKERREIEKNPVQMYQALTPEIIIPQLKAFLDLQLK